MFSRTGNNKRLYWRSFRRTVLCKGFLSVAVPNSLNYTKARKYLEKIRQHIKEIASYLADQLVKEEYIKYINY